MVACGWRAWWLCGGKEEMKGKGSVVTGLPGD